MEALIKVNNLVKKFGDKIAVDKINFEVAKGSFFAFLGQNGAGKSTTIKMLIGLLTPDQGEIIYGDNQSYLQFKDQIGVVFQENVFDDLLTVKENLQLYGSIYLANKSMMLKRYQQIIELLDLKEVEKKAFKTLSGGQKRKAEIARALFASPQILFLDEPTTGLDPKTRIEVWELLHKIRNTTQMAIFLTTHYMEETIDADQVVIIDHGKILCTGTASQLKEQYSTDQLFIVPFDNKCFENQLKHHQIPFTKNVDNYIITTKDTLRSIELLYQLKANIKSYEVKKGSMDDVFLNVVGRTLKEDQS